MKYLKVKRGRKTKTTWGRTMAIILTILIFGALFIAVMVFQLIDIKFRTSDAVEKLNRTANLQRGKVLTENEAMRAEIDANTKKSPNPSKDEIEAYVKKIFGADASVAIAISHHECGPTNKTYPKCQLKSEVENSIGLFQINLANKSQWIHAGRIPGETIAEKKLWLENPYQNTLYAYWVFKTSGFNPWSAYTSGNYLADMKGGK